MTALQQFLISSLSWSLIAISQTEHQLINSKAYHGASLPFQQQIEFFFIFIFVNSTIVFFLSVCHKHLIHRRS